jgi:hypothetical protein
MHFDETPISPSQASLHQFDETTLKILESQKGKIESFDIESYDLFTGKNSSKTDLLKNQNESENQSVTIDDIYFQPEFTSHEFQTALHLLNEAQNYCQIAINEFRKSELFKSDDTIQHLQALLPELFCCRGLSESLAATTNAIQNALFNNKGLPLSEAKLLALQNIIVTIRNQPFMKYDAVIDVISDFEEAGFVVEPQGYEFLTKILDD